MALRPRMTQEEPMTILILGLIIFIGAHSFTMARAPRAQAIARLREGAYKGLYSLVSLLGLVLIIWGFGAYRAEGYIQLWNPPVWTRHLSLLLVWPAFVAFAAAYLPGRIKGTLKHPMLAALKFWALAHLLANGDLGSMLLFAGLLAWAVAARNSPKRRDEVLDHGGPAAAPAGWRNDLMALAIGTVAYLVFLIWLHPLLIGVPALPR